MHQLTLLQNRYTSTLFLIFFILETLVVKFLCAWFAQDNEYHFFWQICKKKPDMAVQERNFSIMSDLIL